MTLDYKINELVVSPFNIRSLTKTEISDELESLKQSIESKGIIEPLVVRPIIIKSKDGKLKVEKNEVVVGQRRFIAAQQLGLMEVPCITLTLTDQEALEYSLIENLQRKDVRKMDIAKALKKLADMMGGTSRSAITVIAKKIGMSDPNVWRYLSLLGLAPEVQEMVDEEELPLRDAVRLSPLSGERQIEVAESLPEMPSEELKDRFIRRTKEEPDKPVEEIKQELFPTNFAKFEIRTPNMEMLSFSIPFSKFKIFYKRAEYEDKLVSELLCEIIEEKIAEWE